MRYRHFVFRPRKHVLPRALLALSVAYHFPKSASGELSGAAVLDKWAVALSTPGPNGWGVVRECEGTDAAGFWRTVEQAATRSPGVWIISWEFRKCAALLKLWDRMETRNVRLDGTDSVECVELGRVVPDVQGPGDAEGGRERPQRPAGPVPQVRDGERPQGQSGRLERAKQGKRPRGYCVLEDPPVHLVFRVGAGSPLINWADAANYGLTTPAETVAPMVRARSLAVWFADAASALFRLGPCGWCATAGSQAMHLWRAAYVREPIFAHVDPGAARLETHGLFGGRAECFALGTVRQRVYLYDYRSLYPSICATLPVPVRLVGMLPGCDVAHLRADVPGHWRIAEVDVETDDADYPMRKGENVIYPRGRFTTTLCGDELRDALRAGRVRRVRHCALYESAPVLADFSQALFGTRKRSEEDGNTLLSEWSKALVVSLFGKFAQRERWWELRPEACSPFPWWEGYRADESGEFRRYRCLAGNTAREHVGGFAHGTLPAVTCAVTAAGRVRLLAALRAAGRPNVYYCDTDALIVNRDGRDRLEASGLCHPTEWGRLRLLEESDSCDIRGLRNYTIGGRVRESGRPRGDLLAVAKDGACAVWPWIGQSLRRQSKPEARAAYVPYFRGVDYEGGNVDESGEVRPFTVNQWGDL